MEKWVKVAIGAVIAILSLSIVATSVYSMTQEKVREEVVTFEVLTLTKETTIGSGTVTPGTYDKILLYSELDGEIVTNVVSILINNVIPTAPSVTLRIDNTSTVQFYAGARDEILINDELTTRLNLLTLNDVVSITFEVTETPVISGVTATLLSLIPLLFIGGIVYFTLSKREI